MGKGAIRRWLSRTYRWLRAFWTMLYGLRQHASQKGADLPSLPRRVVEQARLLVVSGITPTNYYRFRLHRRDVAPELKYMFLGFFEGWRWQDAVNQPEFAGVVFDKYLFSQLLRSWSIPQPACLGVFGLLERPGDQRCADRLRTELHRFLSQPDAMGARRQHLFLKPVFGRGGTGGLGIGACLDDGEAWRLPPHGLPVTLDELVERIAQQDTPFLAQERMFPHDGLSCFGTEVLHTIRLMTVLDGSAEVVHATLKIGLGELPVDNTMKGNAMAGVDLRTGIVGQARVFDDLQGIAAPRPIDLHPVTGCRFAGQRIPMWEEALEMVKQAASYFYPLAVLAWDIAITTRGPVVIEANTRANIALTQMANDEGLLLTPLGDYLYRYNHLDKVGVGIGLKATYEKTRRMRTPLDAGRVPADPGAQG